MLNLTRLHLGIAHESQFQGLGIICQREPLVKKVGFLTESDWQGYAALKENGPQPEQPFGTVH